MFEHPETLMTPQRWWPAMQASSPRRVLPQRGTLKHHIVEKQRKEADPFEIPCWGSIEGAAMWREPSRGHCLPSQSSFKMIALSQSSFNSIASHCQILSLQLQVDSVQVIVCKHFHFQNCGTASINFSQTFLTLTLNALGLSKKIEIAVDL